MLYFGNSYINRLYRAVFAFSDGLILNFRFSSHAITGKGKRGGVAAEEDAADASKPNLGVAPDDVEWFLKTRSK